jgi:hypothetical protein
MIRLFINQYTDKNPARNKELEKCFTINQNYFGFENVITFNTRLPFSDFFAIVNLCSEENDISIIANSDIYFEGLSGIDNIQGNEVYALSRWDGNTLYDHEDSQDAWVFRGKIKPIPDCNFGLGIPGCDNAIAERLHRAGYTVLNPSKSIKAIHLHSSNIRNYNRRTMVVPKPYLLIKPHFLDETPSHRFIR